LRESEPMRLVDSGGEAILSKREQDVVRCVAEGQSNREIASSLGLTEHTVKNYLFRIFDKLGVSSRVEVVLYVYRFRKDWMGATPNSHRPVAAPGPKLLVRPAHPTPAEPAVVGH
jgi:DNA-binding CsgD family transcriptional regulator